MFWFNDHIQKKSQNNTKNIRQTSLEFTSLPRKKLKFHVWWSCFPYRRRNYGIVWTADGCSIQRQRQKVCQLTLSWTMQAPPFSWRHFPFVRRKVMGLGFRQDQRIKIVWKFSHNSCPFYFFRDFFHFPDLRLFYFQDRKPTQWHFFFSIAVLNDLPGSDKRTKGYSRTKRKHTQEKSNNKGKNRTDTDFSRSKNIFFRSTGTNAKTFCYF